jgi:hypothetical protein
MRGRTRASGTHSRHFLGVEVVLSEWRVGPSLGTSSDIELPAKE